MYFLCLLVVNFSPFKTFPSLQPPVYSASSSVPSVTKNRSREAALCLHL